MQASQGRRRASYGIDAPYVPGIMGGIGVAAVIVGAVISAIWMIVIGALFLAQAALYLHTTLCGKFRIWEQLLDELDLSGTEQIVDIGCGRGAVLLAAARRLTHGTAHGVDLWRSVDQSGNDESATRRNAETEGVSRQVELHTADMRKLPFPDGSIDVVVSSLAIHNLPTAGDRNAALDDALRVLHPGGRLMIADIRHVRAYAEHLRAAGLETVRTRSLGADGWFGNPFVATVMVTATKP